MLNSSDALRTAGRLLAAKATGRSLPFQVTAVVTYRCNLRCAYCSLPELPSSELAASDWKRIIDELHALGTRRVLFFGGEPLMRPDLDEMVAHTRAHSIACALTTNGTLVPQRESLIRRLQMLTVSLDGIAAAHDANRGPGQHEEALRAIECAREWGVPVKVNAVMTAESAGDLPRLIELCERERLPLTINPVRSEANGLYGRAAGHKLDGDRLRDLVRQIRRIRKHCRWIVFSDQSYRVAENWPDPDVERSPTRNGRAGAPVCSAGRFHCTIDPDGRLYPCVLTIGQVPALNAAHAGVSSALAHIRNHGCAACCSPCMVETNSLYALSPRALAGHLLHRLSGRFA